MAKEIICREVGFECEGRVQGDSIDAVLAAAAAHLRSTHGVTEVTPDVLDRAIASVRDVPLAAAAEHRT